MESAIPTALCLACGQTATMRIESVSQIGRIAATHMTLSMIRCAQAENFRSCLNFGQLFDPAASYETSAAVEPGKLAIRGRWCRSPVCSRCKPHGDDEMRLIRGGATTMDATTMMDPLSDILTEPCPSCGTLPRGRGDAPCPSCGKPCDDHL
jgi:hypothetical protein